MAGRKLQHLRVYSSPDVMAAVMAAYDACWRWGHYATHGNDDDAFYERQEEYNAAELDLYQGIRRDLGIVSSEPGGAPLPGSGWELVEEPAAPAPAPE